jgi:putative DNA primase/helicase
MPHSGVAAHGDSEGIVATPNASAASAAGEQGTAVVFPNCDPWPDKVDGLQLLDDIAHTIQRFVVLAPAARDAAALWVLHAYAHAVAEISPMLIVTSPEKRCGKTTLGTVLGALVPRALHTANLTPPVLYRAIQTFSPTLIVDEADTFLVGRSDLGGILNSGHQRTSAQVMRNTGSPHVPRHFSTWAPKIIMGIAVSQLNGTLIDRSIVLELKRRTASEPVEKLRLDKLDALCTPLRQRSARWVADHIEAARTSESELSDGLNDRAADNWRLIIAIAEEAGPRWLKRARAAALRLSAGDEERGEDSPGVRLLTDIRDFFAAERVEVVPTAVLLAWLIKREDRPWAKWQRGKPITATALAKLLRLYDIAPKMFRVGATTPRGYELGQFLDAFGRYLSINPTQSTHPAQPTDTTTYESSGCDTGGDGVPPKKVA